ncbi:hypothetical protein [Candidatus Avelusimicrobium alvi]|uniref:hypothetical protein n=1 Tax=Candidatus Avelusimicrobium alvi TaxID=3416221 RepID=UPI003D0CF12F
MKILKIISVILVLIIGLGYFKYYNLKTANGAAPKVLQKILTEDQALGFMLNFILDNNAKELISKSCNWTIGFRKDTSTPIAMCQTDVTNMQGQKIHIQVSLVKDSKIKHLHNQDFKELNGHGLTTDKNLLDSENIYLVNFLFGEDKGNNQYSVKFYFYNPETKGLIQA